MMTGFGILPFRLAEDGEAMTPELLENESHWIHREGRRPIADSVFWDGGVGLSEFDGVG